MIFNKFTSQALAVLVIFLWFNQPAFAKRAKNIDEAQEYLSTQISEVLAKKVKKQEEAERKRQAVAQQEQQRLAQQEEKRQKQQQAINSIKIKFVPIPAGTFRMGDIQGTGYDDEKPVHRVRIKAFYMSKTEITQAQWQTVMGNNPSAFKTGGNYPVDNVSWDDVQDFITELNQRTGRTYRLPSEAEWEYAARAGSSTKYSWGNNITHNNANYGNLAQGKDKWEQTSPVASFSSNAFGLYDMAGNVGEWTQDCWNSTYAKAPTNGSAWESGNCAQRVLRGGSWCTNPARLRSANRFRNDTDDRSNNYGFRLIQDRNP